MSTISSIEELAEVEDGTVLKLLTVPNASNARFENLGGTEVRKEGTQVWIGQVPIHATSLNAALASGLLIGPETWDGTMEVGQAYRCNLGIYFVLGVHGDDITYLWLPNEEGGGRKSFATNPRTSLFDDIQPVGLTGEDLELAQSALREVGVLVGYASGLEVSVTEAREEGRLAGLNELRTALVEGWDDVNYQAHELNEVFTDLGLDPLPPDQEDVEVEVEFSGSIMLANGSTINVNHTDTWTVSVDEGSCACDSVTNEMILDRYPGVDNLYVDSRYCRHD